MKKVLLILIAFIAPFTAIFAQIDLHYERYTNQDDPVAHRDYTSCSNGFGGITAILPEFDTASPDLNMRFVVFDSNMNIKRKYLYKDTNGRKLVPMDIKYSNDGLQYYICGYVIDQSQNLNPWLLILDTSGTVSQSKYLGNNGIFTRILEFNDTLIICAGTLCNSVAFNVNKTCFISAYNKNGILRYQYSMPNAAYNTYFDLINDIEKVDDALVVSGTYSKTCTTTNFATEVWILLCSMDPFNGSIFWAKTITPNGNDYTSPNLLINNGNILISTQNTRRSNVDERINITEFSSSGSFLFCRTLGTTNTMNCTNNSSLNYQLLQDIQSTSSGNIIAYGKFLRSNSNIPWSCELNLNSFSVTNGHIYKTDFKMTNADLYSYTLDSVYFCSSRHGVFPLFTIHNGSKIANGQFLLSTLDKITPFGIPVINENSKSWFVNFDNSGITPFQSVSFTFAASGCPTWITDSVSFIPLLLNSNTNLSIVQFFLPFTQNTDIDQEICPPSNP